MKWTSDKLDQLAAGYRAGTPTKVLAEQIGCSQTAIKSQAADRDLRPHLSVVPRPKSGPRYWIILNALKKANGEFVTIEHLWSAAYPGTPLSKPRLGYLIYFLRNSLRLPIASEAAPQSHQGGGRKQVVGYRLISQPMRRAA